MTAQIYLGRWQDALAHIDTVDAIICDPPYGARTHEGHDGSTSIRSRSGWTRSDGYTEKPWNPSSKRRSINYLGFTYADAHAFVASWMPRCRGWFVAMTSHDLVSAYTDALEAADRYVFAPLPFFSPGSRVRLSGDGPSSWTCWIVVARPRSEEFHHWGTLPGGYVHPPEACEVVGGKPLGLMRAIVRDYSRPGDLVCDPFVGSGTTALACAIEGRRFVGAEEKPEHHAIATKRLSRGFTRDMFSGGDGA